MLAWWTTKTESDLITERITFDSLPPRKTHTIEYVKTGLASEAFIKGAVNLHSAVKFKRTENEFIGLVLKQQRTPQGNTTNLTRSFTVNSELETLKIKYAALKADADKLVNALYAVVRECDKFDPYAPDIADIAMVTIDEWRAKWGEE